MILYLCYYFYTIFIERVVMLEQIKIENIEKTDIIKTIDSIKQYVINTRNKIIYNANI